MHGEESKTATSTSELKLINILFRGVKSRRPAGSLPSPGSNSPQQKFSHNMKLADHVSGQHKVTLYRLSCKPDEIVLEVRKLSYEEFDVHVFVNIHHNYAVFIF